MRETVCWLVVGRKVPGAETKEFTIEQVRDGDEIMMKHLDTMDLYVAPTKKVAEEYRRCRESGIPYCCDRTAEIVGYMASYALTDTRWYNQEEFLRGYNGFVMVGKNPYFEFTTQPYFNPKKERGAVVFKRKRDADAFLKRKEEELKKVA